MPRHIKTHRHNWRYDEGEVLELIRAKLDALCEVRRLIGFNADAQLSYDTLCKAERIMLDRLNAAGGGEGGAA